jgi:hypothetical protein
MEKFKMNLDREPLSSAQIQQMQDFNRLKNDYLRAKKAVWKSPWFWGTGGIASLALVATAVYLNKTESKLEAHEVIITQQSVIDQNNQSDEPVEHVELIQVAESTQEFPAVADKKVLLRQIQDLESKLTTSDYIPDSKGFHFRLDALADEFPEVTFLVGKRLEVIGDKPIGTLFKQEWERIALKEKGENRYALYFQRKGENRTLTVKVVAHGDELQQEEDRLLKINGPIMQRISELRASL